jgi:hypothetical protein
MTQLLVADGSAIFRRLDLFVLEWIGRAGIISDLPGVLMMDLAWAYQAYWQLYYGSRFIRNPLNPSYSIHMFSRNYITASAAQVNNLRPFSDRTGRQFFHRSISPEWSIQIREIPRIERFISCVICNV